MACPCPSSHACRRPAGMAAALVCDRCPVGSRDRLAMCAGVLVLAGQPIEVVRIEKARMEQPGSGAVQTVLTLLSVAEAAGRPRRERPPAGCSECGSTAISCSRAAEAVNGAMLCCPDRGLADIRRQPVEMVKLDN